MEFNADIFAGDCAKLPRVVDDNPGMLAGGGILERELKPDDNPVPSKEGAFKDDKELIRTFVWARPATRDESCGIELGIAVLAIG